MYFCCKIFNSLKLGWALKLSDIKKHNKNNFIWLNLEHKIKSVKVYKFISNKIYKNHNDTISHPIIKVAITAISISICIMIISSSILNGFQQNITNKIIGFGNHIQLSKIQNNSTFNKPIEINQDLEKKILDIKNINKIYPFAYKTGIIN